ncbi:N-acetylmuramoyl-L-alanine amidase, partial [Streptomyces sp. NPDC003487]
MSYAGPEFEPPQNRRSRRRPLVVGLAALVPGALLGWLVYEAVGAPGGPGGTAGTAGATRTGGGGGRGA